jgi:acyl-CoA thioesterase-1
MNSKFTKWLVYLLAAALAVGFIYYRNTSRISYLNLPPTAHGEWIAFGDSLTEGYGASEGHDYPTLLGRKLGVRIHNHGVAGETTVDAMNRLNRMTALKPQVVLLCLGGNDGLQQMSRERMIANLGTMIDQFQRAGSFVVLIGVRGVGLRDQNVALFEKLAREKRVLLVPNILEGVFMRGELMSDGIHPNDAGYEFIAARLEEILKPLLPKLEKH